MPGVERTLVPFRGNVKKIVDECHAVSMIGLRHETLLKMISFSPGFSPVQERRRPERKPFKRFPFNASQLSTGLKPGENEIEFA